MKDRYRPVCLEIFSIKHSLFQGIYRSLRSFGKTSQLHVGYNLTYKTLHVGSNTSNFTNFFYVKQRQLRTYNLIKYVMDKNNVWITTIKKTHGVFFVISRSLRFYTQVGGQW